MTEGKLGLVVERSEGQYYIMKRHPERTDWAIEVAYHLRGDLNNPKSWRLSVGDVGGGDGSKYMVLWSGVDTKHSDFLKGLVSKLGKEQEVKQTK